MSKLGAFWLIACIAVALWPAAAQAAQPIEALGQQARLTQVLPDGEPSLDAQTPALAYNPEKNEFLATWDGSVPPATSRREVFGQLLDGSGAPKGRPVQLTDVGASGDARLSADRPAVAYLPSVNRYVVAYSASMADFRHEIFAQLVDDTGAKVGDPVRISFTAGQPISPGFATHPAIAVDPGTTSERILFVWASDHVAGAADYEIHGAIRTPALTGAGNTQISSNQFQNVWTAPSAVWVPSAGKFAVAFLDGVPSFNDNEVFVELTNLSDQPKPQIQVSDATGEAFAYSPQLAFRPGGGGADELLVAFTKDVAKPGTTSRAREPFVQRLVADTLQEIGEESQIGATAQGIPLFDRALELSYEPTLDRYLVTWAGDAVTDKTERYGQALTGTGQPVESDDFRISTTAPATNGDFDAGKAALALNTTTHQWLQLWEADDQSVSADDELEVYRRLIGENFDRDLDGVPIPSDCNDGDPTIKPGVNDVFDNGVDEDCSGADAENPDRDGDGSPRPADCNDGNAAIKPGAKEVLDNGIDEDCSGADALDLDRDKDGSPRPADCNDANPAVKPGARDIAGNGVDEDCSGADTPELTRAALDRSFALFPSYATIRRLVVTRARPGMRVVVHCSGRGCPKAVRSKKGRTVTVRKAGRLVLTKLFRGARMRAGARLEVAIIEPGAIGKSDAFTFRTRARAPKRVSRCLSPRTTRTTRCPA